MVLLREHIEGKEYWKHVFDTHVTKKLTVEGLLDHHLSLRMLLYLCQPRLSGHQLLGADITFPK